MGLFVHEYFLAGASGQLDVAFAHFQFCLQLVGGLVAAVAVGLPSRRAATVPLVEPPASDSFLNHRLSSTQNDPFS